MRRKPSRRGQPARKGRPSGGVYNRNKGARHQATGRTRRTGGRPPRGRGNPVLPGQSDLNPRGTRWCLCPNSNPPVYLPYCCTYYSPQKDAPALPQQGVRPPGTTGNQYQNLAACFNDCGVSLESGGTGINAPCMTGCVNDILYNFDNDINNMY